MAAARAWLLQLVVATLVAVLAAGSGVAGLVSALSGPPAHVCTCASGGSHARCPVCNPSLGHRARCALPLVDGAPCGERSFTPGAGFEPMLAAAPRAAIVPPSVRVAPQPASPRPYDDVESRPATPPPRGA
jgi:hypothetical protein